MESHFPVMSPSIEVVSDASGSFGCGVFSLFQGWFQIICLQHRQFIHITAKELLPIVVAAAVWVGVHLATTVNLLHNRQYGSGGAPQITHIKRQLAYAPTPLPTLSRSIFASISNALPDNLNTAADAISCNNIPLFFTLFHRSLTLLSPMPSSTCW